MFLVIAPKMIARTAPIINSSLLQRNKLPEAVVKTKYTKKIEAEVTKNVIMLIELYIGTLQRIETIAVKFDFVWAIIIIQWENCKL